MLSRRLTPLIAMDKYYHGDQNGFVSTTGREHGWHVYLLWTPSVPQRSAQRSISCRHGCPLSARRGLIPPCRAAWNREPACGRTCHSLCSSRFDRLHVDLACISRRSWRSPPCTAKLAAGHLSEAGREARCQRTHASPMAAQGKRIASRRIADGRAWPLTAAPPGAWLSTTCALPWAGHP